MSRSKPIVCHLVFGIESIAPMLAIYITKGFLKESWLNTFAWKRIAFHHKFLVHQTLLGSTPLGLHTLDSHLGSTTDCSFPLWYKPFLFLFNLLFLFLHFICWIRISSLNLIFLKDCLLVLLTVLINLSHLYCVYFSLLPSLGSYIIFLQMFLKSH